jgi:photosystem II stability/assembly factor-like uncharacterized protein
MSDDIPTKLITTIFAVGDTIFAGTDNGIYRSTNDGETWIEANTGLSESQMILSFTKSGEYILVGTSGQGVFRSADNGENWEPCSEGLTDLYIKSFS